MTAATTGCTTRYALRDGVCAVDLPDGRTRLLAPGLAETIGVVDRAGEAALSALARGEHSSAELGGAADLVERLRTGGWLRTTVSYQGRVLYTLSPVRQPPPATAPGTAVLRLSRFAVLRNAPEAGGLVIESPTAWCDVRIRDTSVLTVLDGGSGCGLPPEVVPRIRQDLYWSGVLVDGEAESGFRAQQWSPHELLFHERSGSGPRARIGVDFGGTYWAKGSHDPLPARPEPYPGEAVRLPVPDPDALRRGDPALATVLEERRSVRSHDDDAPITLEQLGTFLHRCARSTVMEADGMQYVHRPYPSGGASHELEVYPVVRHAAGVEAGMYHYDSHDHVLRPVRGAGHPAVRQLLRGFSHATGSDTQPQVGLVVSARVGRVMWKYRQMAYALVLRHVGVLYQTMYCVATAMELAPCAVGATDPDLFARATGRDPLCECGVGGFMLGSRPGKAQA